MNAKATNRICGVMFLFGWVNFMTFCGIGLSIGGEALHGTAKSMVTLFW
jgi:hypothetical protein